MAPIPPGWLASIVQGAGAQARAGDSRRREERAGSDAVYDPAAHDLINAVEATDRDSQVSTDAEGAGSQGRSFAEAEAEGGESSLPDADDQNRLDISA